MMLTINRSSLSYYMEEEKVTYELLERKAYGYWETEKETTREQWDLILLSGIRSHLVKSTDPLRLPDVPPHPDVPFLSPFWSP